jgi:hypothetical protein
MALIYLKSLENALVLAPREGFMRPFDFSAWTEIRIGFFASIVSTAGSNTLGTTETVVFNSTSDQWTIGLKSTTSDLPGVVGTDFVGLSSYTGVSGNATTGSNGRDYGTSNAQRQAIAVHDTTYAIQAGSGGFGWATNGTLSSQYCGFLGIKFVIANLGLSNQTIAISTSNTTDFGTTDYSASALQLQLNNATYSAVGSALAWNNGSVAYPIPSNVWFRYPFYNNQARISCIRAIRYAP